MFKRTLSLIAGITVMAMTTMAEDKLPPPGKQDIKNVGSGAIDKIPENTRQYFYAKPEDVKWFEDAKFGIFVHWDPSCLAKTEISWGRKGPRPGCNQPGKSGVPQEVYDNLYKKFDPVNFNADEWIKMVKDSGAKYFIFTAKHHGGFCMFDAGNTDFKITNTPYAKDICKKLADACHKYGIKLFWYYSQPDWHNPYYLSEHHEIYRKYVHDQLRQLLTDYGKVDGVWFDCLNTKWRHWNTPLMVKMIRTLQPGILINSRWGWGMPSVKHNGDFDNPEQKIGKFQVNHPWETCATMGRGWSWRGGGGLLSPKECIKMLVQCVGGGGNLALDCGPRPDGEIDPPEKANYLAMGKWLKRNGEAIYATRGGPYKPSLYGVSTWKGNKAFLHILASFPSAESAKIKFSAIPGRKLLKAYAFADKKPLPFKTDANGISLDLAKVPNDGIDTIVVLEFDKTLAGIAPIDLKTRKIPVVKATASSSYNNTSYAPDALVSKKQGKFEAGIHQSKSWVAKGAKGMTQWAQIEFAHPASINGLIVAEPKGRFLVRKYKLEYDDNGTWKKLYSDDTIGTGLSLIFKPVKTSKIRLTILKHAPYDPGLSRFEAFGTK
jgi:alpha-L-fucosidase